MNVTKNLIEAMMLGEHRGRKSRLNMAYGEVNWYLKVHGKAMEVLVQVQCSCMGRRYLFRLTCWAPPTPKSVTRIYRIPGLLFDETVRDGVGIVLSDGKIIGKMSYGPPACEACEGQSRMMLIKLGSTSLEEAV